MGGGGNGEGDGGSDGRGKTGGGDGSGSGNNGSDLVTAEAELALAKFELETQQREQAVRQKEHRRQLVCLGEPVDADAELALLEAQHGLSRAALDRRYKAGSSADARQGQPQHQ